MGQQGGENPEQDTKAVPHVQVRHGHRKAVQELVVNDHSRGDYHHVDGD
jgi:hypothetical protein